MTTLAEMRPVYDTDKVSAALCRTMQQVGFTFDVDEAEVQRDRLRHAELAARLRVEEACGRALKPTKSGGISTKDLHAAVFSDRYGLRAPVYFRTEHTGRPSLGIDAMRGYAACADARIRQFAVAELERRRAKVVRVMYIEKPMALALATADRRIHPTWNNYGAISGRFSCSGPNLMNLPTARTDPTIVWEMRNSERVAVAGGIRTLYVAAPGMRLVAADAKQLEMRIAAYASGDEAMMAACESTDLHTANALVIFGPGFTAADAGRRKALRNLAKSAGFAVCYLAEAPTVYARILAAGEKVRLQEVNAMLRKLRTAFHGYFRWQDKRLLECIRDGYTTSPILGRRRWLSHAPSPTECANFPIQSGAADVMNDRLPRIADAVRQLGALPVAQVHDSGVFEAPERHAETVLAIYREIFESYVDVGSSGRMLRASFPVDGDISERWH